MNTFSLAADAGETTFFRDVWNYIYGVYSSVDGNYENIGTSGNVSIALVVLGLFIGALAACIISAYIKQVLGALVRKLLAEKCADAEGAKTLDELGFSKNPFLKSAVQSSVSLRRVVKCAEEEEFYRKQRENMEAYEKKRKEEPSLPKFKEMEYRVDPKTDRFYIPQELEAMAEEKFSRKKGSSLAVTVVGVLLLCVGFFLVLLVLPHVLRFVDNFIGSFKK